MGTLRNTFSSSLGKKLIMSLTGLFLCVFLIVHLIGNLQLFREDQGLAFNTYAYFMTHFLPIKVVSYVLYASIILHALYALLLTKNNQQARPIGYLQSNGRANSPWASRNMGILGTLLLIFLIVHMSNFWARYHWGGLPYTKYEVPLQGEGETKVTELPIKQMGLMFSDYIDASRGVRVVIAKDLYKIVYFSFKQNWYVILYVVAMGALAFHLLHGFRSAFQTLGWDHKRYIPMVKFLTKWIFGLFIPAAFAAMPLYFLFFK